MTTTETTVNGGWVGAGWAGGNEGDALNAAIHSIKMNLQMDADFAAGRRIR